MRSRLYDVLSVRANKQAKLPYAHLAAATKASQHAWFEANQAGYTPGHDAATHPRSDAAACVPGTAAKPSPLASATCTSRVPKRASSRTASVQPSTCTPCASATICPVRCQPPTAATPAAGAHLSRECDATHARGAEQRAVRRHGADAAPHDASSHQAFARHSLGAHGTVPRRHLRDEKDVRHGSERGHRVSGVLRERGRPLEQRVSWPCKDDARRGYTHASRRARRRGRRLRRSASGQRRLREPVSLGSDWCCSDTATRREQLMHRHNRERSANTRLQRAWAASGGRGCARGSGISRNEHRLPQWRRRHRAARGSSSARSAAAGGGADAGWWCCTGRTYDQINGRQTNNVVPSQLVVRALARVLEAATFAQLLCVGDGDSWRDSGRHHAARVHSDCHRVLRCARPASLYCDAF